MQNYLAELLTEEPDVKSDSKPVITEAPKKKELSDLLKNVSEKNTLSEPLVSTKSLAAAQSVEKVSTAEPEIVAQEAKIEVPVPAEAKSDASYRKGSFQAMFFEVAGLIVAVPLIELGGIHNVDKTTPLMGKPDWFEGVMIHREDKINIVDTAQWIMPDKCDQALKDSLNYQYVIMLNNSNWGLMAEKLVDTVTVEHDDVKWMESSSKRPWLAGLVKNRMCALLDVESLIKLLNEGADISP